MHIFDFFEAQEEDLNSLQYGNIVTALSLLQKEVSDGKISSELPTAMVIRYIKNTGLTSFTFQDLITANENDPAMKNLVSNITKETVTFKTDVASSVENPDEFKQGSENPQNQISKMAKRALKRRQD